MIENFLLNSDLYEINGKKGNFMAKKKATKKAAPKKTVKKVSKKVVKKVVKKDYKNYYKNSQCRQAASRRLRSRFLSP
jgi:hypothetical protein